jgi:hypothetical protein
MFLLPSIYWLCVHFHMSTLEQSFMGYKIYNVTLLGIVLHLFMLMVRMDSKSFQNVHSIIHHVQLVNLTLKKEFSLFLAILCPSLCI